MDCPKCGSRKYVKDGVVKEKQRYLCKNCKYRYTVEQRAGTGNKAIKRLALELYLEGLGFRSIGRILRFSNVTILNWIRGFATPAKSCFNCDRDFYSVCNSINDFGGKIWVPY